MNFRDLVTEHGVDMFFVSIATYYLLENIETEADLDSLEEPEDIIHELKQIYQEFKRRS